MVGNVSGFLTVLALTGLLRYLPLSVAYPLTMGLGILGVQVLSAHFLFHEALGLNKWLGTLFILAGLFLIYRS